MNETHLEHIPHNCVLKIKAVYNSLKTAERKAVDFLLAAPEQIAAMTIVDFAERAGCSEATIVRLSKRLGYEGFPELKADFSTSERNNPEDFGYEGISRKDDGPTVVRKVFEATIQALKDTLEIMDIAEYERAITALLNARKILWCGLGDAALVAMEACQRFVRIGENAMVSQDPDLELIMSSQLCPGDVLVAISHSGKSRPVLDSIKVAKKAGAVVIAITNFPISPIAKHADIILLTAAFSTQPDTGEVMSKRVAELCIIESLYTNYLMRKGQKAREQLKISDSVVNVNKW
jgi:RpiR family transcriptional regulator, carbohydrate utilization regulator